MVARVGMMAAVAGVALLLQTVVLPAFEVLGWRPDLVTLTVMGFALADGPHTGVRYGFTVGLLADLVSGAGQLLGLSSLVLLLIGWLAGQTRPYLGSSPLVGQMAVGGIGSVVALILQGILALLLDIGQHGPGVLAQGAFVVGLYNTLLAPVVFAPLAHLSTRFSGDPLANV